MLEQLQYKNHLGEVISFGKEGIYVNENDLRDFAWSYTSKNNRISSFKKGVVKKTLKVVIACTSEADGIAKRNALFEVCEKDVLANKHGSFIIGGYYMRCFVIGSKKSEYLVNNQMMKVQLSIATDFPTWIKESTKAFRKSSNPLSPEAGGQNMDYPYDYAFDYAADVINQVLPNEDFASSNFRMTIYGPCISPQIYIAGHTYNVVTEIAANEYMMIDSVEKTIILVKKNGQKMNCFNDRSRDSYIFERIPSGTNAVAWEGDFGFDITLLEERSEPKWT
jgi:hypothetical protein